MKKSNKRLLIRLSTIVCISTVVLVTALFTSSCQKDDPVGYDKNKWDSHEYLDISGEASFANIGNWSYADQEALRRADERATIKKGDDGLFFIEERSAAELNISPKLYGIVREEMDNANDYRLRLAEKMNHIPLTKSDTAEEGGGGNGSPSDCVAQSIKIVLAIFGVNISADEINKELEEKYGAGKGVPVDKFAKEVRRYLKGQKVTVDAIPLIYEMEGAKEIYLIGANVANMGGGHAAPLSKVTPGWLYIKDVQNTNEGKDIQVHREEVLVVYRATGAQTE